MKQATVITGPQGSGKTMKAKQLADSIGRSVTISSGQFFGRFELGAVLHGRPDAVIVEEVHFNRWAMDKIKQMLTQDQIIVERKNKEPVSVPLPHFIFTSNEPLSGMDGRRFKVISL